MRVCVSFGSNMGISNYILLSSGLPVYNFNTNPKPQPSGADTNIRKSGPNAWTNWKTHSRDLVGYFEWDRRTCEDVFNIPNCYNIRAMVRKNTAVIDSSSINQTFGVVPALYAERGLLYLNKRITTLIT